MIEIDMIKLSKIKSNPKNPRVIKDDRFKKLVKSLKEFPEMLEKRKMVCVTDTDGKLFPLGGNMRLKALKEIGYKEIPKDWIDLADEWTEEQRREFTIKDNIGYGEWDWDELANEWDVEQLEHWGLDIPKTKEEIEIEDLFNINIPFYEPSTIKPSEDEIADLSKANELLGKIDGLEIDDNLAAVLRARAMFFTDFNFQKVADYYYHSDDDVKNVMKELGMVIVAPKEALELGFASLGEELFEL